MTNQKNQKRVYIRKLLLLPTLVLSLSLLNDRSKESSESHGSKYITFIFITIFINETRKIILTIE